ncbi:MAG: hypothetical protein QOF35_2306, partial [Actinomycetota bacterium]|nr:hypothetical protein [Actinomycetota bacterium]
MSIRVLVVDDQSMVRAGFRLLLANEADIEVVAEAADGREAVSQAARCHPDVILMDIRMPGLDGLELARVFSSMAQPPEVVFVTAHDDRAVDAFDVGAVDYLLKPLRSERLRGSLDRILSSRVVASNDSGGSDGANDAEVIPVELAGTTKLVPRSAVRYVEAQGDYARLHTNDNKSHLVRIPLSVLEDRWRDA